MIGRLGNQQDKMTSATFLSRIPTNVRGANNYLWPKCIFFVFLSGLVSRANN